MNYISALLLSGFCFFVQQNIFCQDKYELLYLNQDFDKIISTAQNKSSIDDYYWLSLALDEQGKTSIAINTLESGIEKFPNNEKLEMQLANLYFVTGDYQAAQAFLEKYQHNSELFKKYISVIEFQGNHSYAIQLLKEKLVNDSLNLYYLSHLGDNLNQLDSVELAIKCYEKIFKQYPKDQLTAKKLASLYLISKKYVKCIEVCDTILISDSLNLKFFRYKGMASFNERDFTKAETCFDFLYNNGDSGKFILKHLGISEFHNSKLQKSREHLLDAFKLDSNDYETSYYLGKGFINSSTPERGLYYFNRVDSLLQPDPMIISTLYAEKQSIYSAVNNYEEALNCYMLAYKYNPKPEYLFFIASLYQNELHDNKNALKYYTSFLKILPPKPDSENIYKENQFTVSLRKVAETNIEKLKEELFFEGELNK